MSSVQLTMDRLDKAPLAALAVGLVSAAVLLVGGTKGKRYCLPNSRVMMHQPMGGVGGQVSDIEIQAAEMFRYRDVLNQIISSHCGQPVEKIAEDTDRDFFLGANEAKEYGLVDDILTKPEVEDEEED